MKKLLLLALVLFTTSVSYSQLKKTVKPLQEISKPITLNFQKSDFKGDLSLSVQNQMKKHGESFDNDDLKKMENYLRKVGGQIEVLSSTGPFNPNTGPQSISIKLHFKWTNKNGKEREITITIGLP